MRWPWTEVVCVYDDESILADVRRVDISDLVGLWPWDELMRRVRIRDGKHEFVIDGVPVDQLWGDWRWVG